MTFGVGDPLAAHTRRSVFVHTGESVRCPRGRFHCRVTVRGEARAAVPAHRGRALGMVRIGRARIRLAPGKTDELVFRANRTGARLLRRNRRLAVKLTVSVRRDSKAPIVLAHRVVVSAAKRRGPKR